MPPSIQLELMKVRQKRQQEVLLHILPVSLLWLNSAVSTGILYQPTSAIIIHIPLDTGTEIVYSGRNIRGIAIPSGVKGVRRRAP